MLEINQSKGNWRYLNHAQMDKTSEIIINDKEQNAIFI